MKKEIIKKIMGSSAKDYYELTEDFYGVTTLASELGGREWDELELEGLEIEDLEIIESEI